MGTLAERSGDHAPRHGRLNFQPSSTQAKAATASQQPSQQTQPGSMMPPRSQAQQCTSHLTRALNRVNLADDEPMTQPGAQQQPAPMSQDDGAAQPGAGLPQAPGGSQQPPSQLMLQRMSRDLRIEISQQYSQDMVG